MLVQVEDTKFVRDTNSRALINQDYAARDEYYSKVKMVTANKNEINKLNDDVLGLKSEITEIKELLKQLLTK
jgi:hypothetical protein